MDEKMKNKRSNEELGINILCFSTKVAEVADISSVKKTDWNGVNVLLR